MIKKIYLVEHWNANFHPLNIINVGQPTLKYLNFNNFKKKTKFVIRQDDTIFEFLI